MIVMTIRFSRENIQDTEIAPTLEAVSGMGGNNMPIIVETHESDSDTRSKRSERACSLSTGREH